jgi:hypothetical protein
LIIECRYSSLRKVDEGLALASDFESDNIIDFRDSKCGTIQLVRSGGDQNDGTFFLKISLLSDPTTFFKYKGSELTPDADCDSGGWVFTDIPFRYAQVCYTKGTDTTGTVNVWATGKK